MEKKSPEQALQVPFTASLAFRYRVAANNTAVAHPSLPNYLALTSGRTFGIRDDNYHVLPAGGLGAQLTAEDTLGVERPGQAAGAKTMTELTAP